LPAIAPVSGAQPIATAQVAPAAALNATAIIMQLTMPSSFLKKLLFDFIAVVGLCL
jgi:hypothetical protein